FILAGLLVLIVKAPPAWLKARLPFLSVAWWPLTLPLAQAGPAATEPTSALLLQILLFFTKAGAFVFGSGLAVVPFLYEGVVREYRWLNEDQFRDAVAVAMITPGPVVITVAFIGYLVAGLAGATLAAIGVFVPVYLVVVFVAPHFHRVAKNRRVKAFVDRVTAAATGAIARSARTP